MSNQTTFAKYTMPRKLPPSRPPSRPASGQRGETRHKRIREELGGPPSAPSWRDSDPLVRADTPTNHHGGDLGEETWSVLERCRDNSAHPPARVPLPTECARGPSWDALPLITEHRVVFIFPSSLVHRCVLAISSRASLPRFCYADVVLRYAVCETTL